VSYARICLKAQLQLKKIDIDNNNRFHYQVGYWCPLIDASIYGAVADSGTQLSVFDSSALKKQLLIFRDFVCDQLG
jgi:hypothetical protein